MTNQELRVAQIQDELNETETAFRTLMERPDVPHVLEFLSTRIGALKSCLTLCQAMAGIGKPTSGAYC